MYIKINNKIIEIKELKKFKERFKSFKFYLKEIDHGIKLPNKKRINTNFFCQKVDVIVTDKDEKILYLFENLKSEKRKIIFKSKNIYYMPLNTCKYLNIGEKLNIKKTKKECK